MQDEKLIAFTLILLKRGYRGFGEQQVRKCELVTGTIVEYDVFVATDAPKAMLYDKTEWFLLGRGKKYGTDETGWFYKLKQQ